MNESSDPLARVALILGGASTLWADVASLEGFIGRPWPGIVVACNEAGVYWPRRLDYWTSFHPQFFPLWEKERFARGGPRGYVRFARRGIPGLADRSVRPWGGGSSGLLCVAVAKVELALPRGVLCGVPLDDRPHFHDRDKGKSWKAADQHWRIWEPHIDGLRGWLRSMSGRTRKVFGAPTMRWLNGEE